MIHRMTRNANVKGIITRQLQHPQHQRQVQHQHHHQQQQQQQTEKHFTFPMALRFKIFEFLGIHLYGNQLEDYKSFFNFVNEEEIQDLRFPKLYERYREERESKKKKII